MRIRRLLAVWLLSLAGLLSTACAPVPVTDIDHQTVYREDEKPLTLEDMTRAIRLAALRQDWKQVEVIEPGHIVATQRDEDNTKFVSVDILYTTTEYSIHYKDSKGMKYNAANRTIGHHYKSMLNDLHEEIAEMIQVVTPGS
ncbi:MAG: hypothetical protein ACM3ZT_11925 [Bacillota bacterium]